MFIKCPYCHKEIEIDCNDEEVICPYCHNEVMISDKDRSEAETEEMFILDDLDIL